MHSLVIKVKKSRHYFVTISLAKLRACPDLPIIISSFRAHPKLAAHADTVKALLHSLRRLKFPTDSNGVLRTDGPPIMLQIVSDADLPIYAEMDERLKRAAPPTPSPPTFATTHPIPQSPPTFATTPSPPHTQPLLQLPDYYTEQPGRPQQPPTTTATAISPTTAYRALTAHFARHCSFTAGCSLCGQQVTPLACGVVVALSDVALGDGAAKAAEDGEEEQVVCVACLEQKQETYQRSTRCSMSKKRALTWLRYHGAQMSGRCAVCEDPECQLELLGDGWQSAHLQAYATGVARGDLQQLAPAHARCNSGQGTRTLSQYQQEIGVKATLKPLGLQAAKELYARLVAVG